MSSYVVAIAAARLRWCWRARNSRSSDKVDLSSDNLTSGLAVGNPVRYHTGAINRGGLSVWNRRFAFSLDWVVTRKSKEITSSS